MKHKKGDWVKVKSEEELAKMYKTIRTWNEIKKHAGKWEQIERMNKFNFYIFKGDKDKITWEDKDLEDNSNGAIQHLIRGNKTIIKLPNGKVGIAKCDPKDEFSEGVGAVIALARAYRVDLKEVAKIDCGNVYIPKNRKKYKIAEIGDYAIAKCEPLPEFIVGQILECCGNGWFEIKTGKSAGEIRYFNNSNSYTIISSAEAKRLIKKKNKE